jgi:RNA polymerase sigma-70 factor (ECF subfamily)
MTNDLELFNRIKTGDEFAFESLFKEYYKSLCIFGLKIVKDAILAEEIVEDIFFQLWEKKTTLELNTSVKSYLFKAVYNNSLKHLRHQKIVLNHESQVRSNLESGIQYPENYAETGEIMHIIRKTLEQVPEKTRQIFEQNRYEGLKYNEIAEQMGISVKTVEAHISSILKLFRENLKDYLIILWIISFVFPIG